MMFEVENKYPVDDLADLEKRLSACGAHLEPPQVQVDRYYRHPVRDFAQTDEALRIRSAEGRNVITYKGPKLDSTTKTRREIELPIHAGPAGAQAFDELLEALGFRYLAEVRKQRRRVVFPRAAHEVEGALDEVDGLGTFFELELVVPESEVDAAKICLRSLAEALGLSASERRSYLELLLEARPH